MMLAVKGRPIALAWSLEGRVATGQNDGSILDELCEDLQSKSPNRRDLA